MIANGLKLLQNFQEMNSCRQLIRLTYYVKSESWSLGSAALVENLFF